MRSESPAGLFVIGASHHKTPVEILERFSVDDSREAELERLLDGNGNLEEFAVLSTCNRVECYGRARDPGLAREELLGILSEFSRMGVGSFEDKIYFKTQADAVRHLFIVASGLDSVAVGETEILGQVKDAYYRYHRRRKTGRILNPLFQRALGVGKKVRTETAIGIGKISIASIALDLAAKIFFDLSTKGILLLGSGELGRTVLDALVARGIRHTLIAARPPERARTIPQGFRGEVVSLEEIDGRMRAIDILITSAASPTRIISRDRVGGWMGHRHGRSLFVMDLAVPRNVEEAAGALDDVYLYNLDDLKSVADRNRLSREDAVGDCERIIKEATRRFMERMNPGNSETQYLIRRRDKTGELSIVSQNSP